MSVSFTAKAIIGCQIDPILLWDIEKNPPCEHIIPDDAKFCPECGTENVPDIAYIPKFHTEDSKGSLLSDYARDNPDGYDCKIGEVSIIASTFGRYAFAGIIMCRSGWDETYNYLFLSTKDIDDLKQKTKDALEPLGFWNDSFGLYAVKELD